MRTRSTISIVTYLATFGCAIFLYLFWQGFASDLSSWLLTLLLQFNILPRPWVDFLVLLVVILLPFILFFIILFEVVAKLLILQSLPSRAGYELAHLDSVPELDQNVLTTYTEELEQLGFVRLLDGRDINFSNAYFRLFCHPQHRCFANLGQLIQRSPDDITDNLPMNCMISSLLEQHWSLGTSNIPYDGINSTAYAFMRLPRSVSIKIPNATFATMLQAHLELRQQMSNDLNANVISDLSVDVLYQVIQRNMRKIKQRIWRKSILYGMVEQWLYSLSPKTAWFGDYAPFVRRRQHQG